MAPVRGSQAGTDIKRRRIPEIDFWRGVALIVILIDHVPWNGLDYLTPQNFGFSDAAEAFVFLSGISVSLAYAPMLQKAGFGRLVQRCAVRAGKLYLVQIAMIACSIAIPLAAAAAVGDLNIAVGQGLSRFVYSPVSAIVSAAALGYTPNFSGVLALYVILILWAPVVIFLASRSCALALLASIAIYIAGRGRVGGDGDSWYFNPFAWQLLFSIGVICALKWRRGLPRPQGILDRPRSGHHSCRRDPVHKSDGSQSRRFRPFGSRQTRPWPRAARAFFGAGLRDVNRCDRPTLGGRHEGNRRQPNGSILSRHGPQQLAVFRAWFGRKRRGALSDGCSAFPRSAPSFHSSHRICLHHNGGHQYVRGD